VAPNVLEKETNRVGLKINESKTKYMIAAGNERTIRDETFEVVKENVYFGSLVAPYNDVSQKVQRRIQTANRCFFRLR
jgi:hypothetical protein